jgi:hypothetical protein
LLALGLALETELASAAAKLELEILLKRGAFDLHPNPTPDRDGTTFSVVLPRRPAVGWSPVDSATPQLH